MGGRLAKDSRAFGSSSSASAPYQSNKQFYRLHCWDEQENQQQLEHKRTQTHATNSPAGAAPHTVGVVRGVPGDGEHGGTGGSLALWGQECSPSPGEGLVAARAPHVLLVLDGAHSARLPGTKVQGRRAARAQC